MTDLVLVVLGSAFFVVAVAYAAACDRLQEREVIFDFVLAGIVTLGVLGYLVYALIHPERF